MEKEHALDEFRRKRVEFFRTSPQSPIPAWDKPRFKGLEFYPFNAALVFGLPLQEYPEKETILLDDTQGRTQQYLRWGFFEFELDSHIYTLTAYKQTAQTTYLWLPFKDTTNGFDTYAAGRYLDLSVNNNCNENGLWTVDFNKAYTPFCAYNDKYVCPFIPSENYLPIAIRAGERNYFRPRLH